MTAARRAGRPPARNRCVHLFDDGTGANPKVAGVVAKLAREKRMDRGMGARRFLSDAINYLARNYWDGAQGQWTSEPHRIAYLILMRAILQLSAEAMMPAMLRAARREAKP